MSNSDKRIAWVDLLKGLAILWLIVYHMHIFDWMRSPVPVFFFLSGLFFSEGKSFGSFVGKKAKALLIPLLFFFILGVAASALKCYLQGEMYSFPPLWLFATMIPIDAVYEHPIGVGAIWFLVVLFEIYIIYYFLRMVSKNKWWLFLAGFLLYSISYVILRYYAHDSFFYLFYSFGFCIYFIIAHLLREKVLYSEIPVWLLIISVAAYCFKFLDISNILNINSIGGGIMLRIKGLISVSGLIVVFIWTCKKLMTFRLVSESKVCNFMVFEGRNSLTILGVHMLVMGVMALLLKKFMPIGWPYYLLLFVIIVVLSNICILLFNRYVPFLVNHKTEKTK